VTAYADHLTLGQARRLYFDANGFGDGGYDKKWVKLEAGPIPIFIPNSKGRVRAVRLHDLHHVLTGYDTTWTGESEIGAWEIGAGCADHWAAWVLNFNAIAIGLAIAPAATYRAFVRGRRTRSLYDGEFRESLLDEKVGAVRARLGLDRAPRAAGSDPVVFALVCVVGVITLLVTTLISLAPFFALGWLVAG
jgi:hypothetical protein